MSRSSVASKKEDKGFFTGPDGDGKLLDRKHWLYLKHKYALTPREVQVGMLTCHGHTIGRVAEAIRVKQGTARTHLRNLYRKVHVGSKILLLLRFIGDINAHYGTSIPAQPQRSVKTTARNVNRKTGFKTAVNRNLLGTLPNESPPSARISPS